MNCCPYILKRKAFCRLCFFLVGCHRGITATIVLVGEVRAVVGVIVVVWFVVEQV